MKRIRWCGAAVVWGVAWVAAWMLWGAMFAPETTVAMAETLEVAPPGYVPAEKPEVPAVQYEIAFEFSDDTSPELREWVDTTLSPICGEWYPKLVEMLPSDGFTAPRTFTIRFQKGDGVAYTSGTTVVCLSPWFDRNLRGEAAGAVVHELVHVVQQYRGGRGRQPNPGWLVEGLTDYIRWFLYEPVVRPIRIDPDRSKYTDSYQVTATFLKYVLEKYDSDLIVAFNTAMREGKYSESLWTDRTGKTLDNLWSEFADSLRNPATTEPGPRRTPRRPRPETTEPVAVTTPAENAEVAAELQRLAERYLKLALETGEHDPDFVDAYYGPAEWREEAKAAGREPAAIERDTDRLLAELRAMKEELTGGDGTGSDEPVTLAALMTMIETASPQSLPMLKLRQRFLEAQGVAMRTRLRIVQGDLPAFDDEVRLIYDVNAPVHSDEYFHGILGRLAAALPPETKDDDSKTAGDKVDFTDAEQLRALSRRYGELASRVVIPEEKYHEIFVNAIAMVRKITQEKIPTLPEEEKFEVSYVRGAPWGAYAWYQGNYHTKIEVNLHGGLTIDSPVGLAAHEGYPGHHVYYTLVEQHLVRRCGWIEHSMMALYSPQAVLAEGAACLAPEMAFPGEEMMRFERDVLAPIAGLEPSDVEAWYHVRQAMSGMRWLGIEQARRYLTGGPMANEDRSQRRAEISEWTARNTVRGGFGSAFLDKYRSYIACYAIGEDLLDAELLKLGAGSDQPDRRWEVYQKMLYTPIVPSMLGK